MLVTLLLLFSLEEEVVCSRLVKQGQRWIEREICVFVKGYFVFVLFLVLFCEEEALLGANHVLIRVAYHEIKACLDLSPDWLGL